MFAEQMAETVQRIPFHQLDHVAQLIWKGLASGALTDQAAEALSNAVEARRSLARAFRSSPALKPAVRAPVRTRAHLERRRRLAASGPMPHALAAHFTTAELAALRIISDECRAHGACDRSIAEIAMRAGCRRTSVQNALRRARELGLLSISHRRRRGPSLTNLVTIISREWLAWIAKRPKTSVQKTECLRKEGNKGTANVQKQAFESSSDALFRASDSTQIGV